MELMPRKHRNNSVGSYIYTGMKLYGNYFQIAFVMQNLIWKQVYELKKTRKDTDLRKREQSKIIKIIKKSGK